MSFLLESDPAGLTWKWASVKPGGLKPAPRSGVGLTVTQAGLGYTFGGVLDVAEDEESVEGNFSNEMHTFDVAKQVWRLVELKEPSKASKKDKSGGDDEDMATDSAAKTVTNDGVFTMSVGGGGSSGLSMFATAAERARHAPNPCNVPSPRMKANLVVCKKKLYLFGGIVEEGSTQYTLADFYSLGEFE